MNRSALLENGICEPRRYWAGKRGERCPRRRHYACDRRITNDGRRSDGVIRACPPSHRPKAPYFDSARIRFDDGPSFDSPLIPGLALPWCRVVRRPLAPPGAFTTTNSGATRNRRPKKRDDGGVTRRRQSAQQKLNRRASSRSSGARPCGLRGQPCVSSVPLTLTMRIDRP